MDYARGEAEVEFCLLPAVKSARHRLLAKITFRYTAVLLYYSDCMFCS